MQAMVLAAGMGRRMGKYTAENTKCMIEVGGVTLIKRVVSALKKAGINHLIMVIGYEGDKLRKYIDENITDMTVEYIYNYDYETTNNIYSLYMARDYLTRDDTILLESDLVFEDTIIKRLVDEPDENVVVVAKYEQWMDGTMVVLDNNNNIRDFIDKLQFKYEDVNNYYKTVNIYKFSKEYSQNQYIPFLEAYIKAYGSNQYYEQVLKALAHIRSAELKAMVLGREKWYELDDSQDYDIADTIFADEKNVLSKYERHFGGYWRFPRLVDFCYLVNPFYPPKKMVNQMKYFFDDLLTQYPSGMSIQKLNAGSMFDIDEDYLLVGNGAAELISALGRCVSGNMLIQIPTFNEYHRCFSNCNFIKIDGSKLDYRLIASEYINRLDECDMVVIINPDNPSGSFLTYDELEPILIACKDKNKLCIIDESFVDFAEKDIRYTLLKEDILDKYPNLIVVKSISKSYGIPGIRLGVLATSNKEMLQKIRYALAIWNINSFGEYYLQIQRLYKASFVESCNKIGEERARFISELSKFKQLRVFPSQANYIMCEVLGELSSKDLATKLVVNYDILIKNLSNKEGFENKSYIRVAVKNQEDNDKLINALKDIFN